MKRFRRMFSRRRMNDDLSEEMKQQLEEKIEALIAEGMPRDEAVHAARRAFGNATLLEQRSREVWMWPLVESIWADIKFALRQLRKSPGFTAIAIGSLAVGIGANTAIFVLAKQVLLDRLAVPQAQQLQIFRWTAPEHSIVHHSWGDLDSTPGGQVTGNAFPYPVYRQLRRDNHWLGDLFAFKDMGRLAATVDGEAVAVRGQMVAGNYYRALGVRPELGRAILPSDDAVPGSGAVVVISDSFWTRRFGRYTSVLGRTMNLNGRPVTMIGVNPPHFTGAADVHLSPDVFLPFSMQPVVQPNGEGSVLNDSGLWWVQVMARSKADTPIPAAQAAFDAMFQSWARANAKPGKNEAIPQLVLADGSRGLNASARTLAQPVYVLVALAGLVLLLACANLAHLLLARFSARRREMVVRIALGAGRTRIVRQMLTESLLLSSLGGIAGFGLAYIGRNALPDMLSPSWQSNASNGHSNWCVFAFATCVTIFTGLLFGAAPALKGMRADVSSGLKNQAHTATHRRRGFTGKSIVSFQVALSALLIVGAILFGRTLFNLDAVNPGFRTDHLVLFTIQLPHSQYTAPTDVALFRNL